MARKTSSSRRSATTASRKKRYHPPVLILHGSLLRLTKVKGGTMNDGAGKPASKTGGMNM